MIRAADGKSQGFTLLEVIIALAILGVSLAVLLRGFGGGLDRLRRSEAEATAGALAQSLLARLGHEWPVEEGDIAGEFTNGFHWRMRTEPYGEPEDRKAWPIGAYRVWAEVSWDIGDGRRSVTLTTMRLRPQGQK